MRPRTLFVASLFASLLAAAPAPAVGSRPSPQGTLSVNPNPLVAGDVATISYSNPAKAGEKITVTIKSGDPDSPETQTVVIKLDEAGTGSVTWTVPGWDSAKFVAPSAPDVTRQVT